MFHYTVVKTEGPGEIGDAVAFGHKVYAFSHLDNSSRHMSVHVYNTVSLRWTDVCPVSPGREGLLDVPDSREGYTAVLVGDIVYIWGGFTRLYHICNILYAFDVDTHRWFQPKVSGTVPEGRENHSACVLGKVMFIHGGRRTTDYYNDICKLDTATMNWTLINTGGTSPVSSHRHSANIIGTKMFVFGGAGRHRLHQDNNIRVFDTETNLWLTTAPTTLPERRWWHSAFAYNGELYLFGENRRKVDDLWKFNPETFSWKKVKPKGNGPLFGGSCCVVGDRIVVTELLLNNLFILDLSPSLNTLCKLAVIQYGLEQSELPHDIRWELAAMMNKKPY